MLTEAGIKLFNLILFAMASYYYKDGQGKWI